MYVFHLHRHFRRHVTALRKPAHSSSQATRDSLLAPGRPSCGTKHEAVFRTTSQSRHNVAPTDVLGHARRRGQRYARLSVTRTTPVANTIAVDLDGVFAITAAGAHHRRGHTRKTRNDTLVYLDIGYKFHVLTKDVDGVLGQTCRPNKYLRHQGGSHGQCRAATMPVKGSTESNAHCASSQRTAPSPNLASRLGDRAAAVTVFTS